MDKYWRKERETEITLKKMSKAKDPNRHFTKEEVNIFGKLTFTSKQGKAN